MTWSYDPANLGSSPRDVVRLSVGDTESQRPLISDEEIDYRLSLVDNNPDQAAWMIASDIASKFSSRADRSVGSLSLSFGRRANAFVELAKRLKRRATEAGGPIAGGLGPSYLGGRRDDYDRSLVNIVDAVDTRTHPALMPDWDEEGPLL